MNELNIGDTVYIPSLKTASDDLSTFTVKIIGSGYTKDGIGYMVSSEDGIYIGCYPADKIVTDAEEAMKLRKK